MAGLDRPTDQPTNQPTSQSITQPTKSLWAGLAIESCSWAVPGVIVGWMAAFPHPGLVWSCLVLCGFSFPCWDEYWDLNYD